jgi:hypothetical protein
MKTLHEIFKTNPGLLEEPEVKEMVEQFRIQFQKLKNDKYEFWDKVTEITMNSELFVIQGQSCKDALSKIHEIAFK